MKPAAAARGRDEREFLPAALEILEEPPSPAGRAVLWVIMLSFAAAVSWASYAQVDIVATAPGKIIPSGQVKTIQPLESGIVRAIHVHDGMRVQQGDALVELDPAVAIADVNAIGQRIAKLEKTLPMARERAAALKALSDQDLVARRDYVDADEQRISVQQDLAALRFELQKATEKTRWQTLTAPVAGVVQQLKLHTIGGVVRPAEPLLVIVPQDQHLEVQALVANQDIGFVRPGQVVALKLETFPFTRYGIVDGRLVDVSQDAVQDEKLGLVYPARVEMSRSVMNIDGKEVKLGPGMAVVVEIKTGKRRVIEYFLSPILASASQSIHER